MAALVLDGDLPAGKKANDETDRKAASSDVTDFLQLWSNGIVA